MKYTKTAINAMCELSNQRCAYGMTSFFVLRSAEISQSKKHIRCGDQTTQKVGTERRK